MIVERASPSTSKSTVGFTVDNIAAVCAAGANVIVSGSGVYGTVDRAATIGEMRRRGEAARS